MLQSTRTHILNEVVETERNYVDGLHLVVEVRLWLLKNLRNHLFIHFKQHLMEPLRGHLDTATFRDLFPQENIKILATVGQQFLESLQKKMTQWSHTTTVGDVFLELVCLNFQAKVLYVS